jgi:Leucine-rich repeat (LRR) protein
VGLHSLQELNLAHNHLVALPPAALADLRDLVFLNLNFNRLQAPPAGLSSSPGLPRLRELLLAYNRIAALPAGALAGVTGLARLDLGGNRLVDIGADGLEGLGEGLSELVLSGNMLARLPAGGELHRCRRRLG